MWRYQSVHERGESQWLDEALRELMRDPDLRARADAALAETAAREPLLAEALRTPQSPPYHCEGPTLEHHLRRMLTVLYAVLDEKLHLIDLEEFRRLKGYEGEIDELEETLKEQAGAMETFVLCHDAAKWATVTFTALEKSRGATLGFSARPSHAWDEAAAERAQKRSAYRELYQTFAKEHANEPDAIVEQEFFEAYGIEAHYPGHDRAIHTSVYRSLLYRVGEARRLTGDDIGRLEDIIALHLGPFADFSSVRPERIRRYMALAEKRGYDADDFLDLLQACLFLDGVCGSARRSEQGLWNDPTPLINFFRSEHEYAPWRRAEKEAKRAEEHARKRNRLFREVGLDGVALLKLLGMKAGKTFGELLKGIQAAVKGEGEMPALPPEVAKEVARRAEAFHEKMFEKAGEDE
jgi:hypothetical protein